MTDTATSYDQVVYPGHPLQQTHPDRLATLATLFGMSPAPVERCRVLELGCGDGANLLPMALALPESRFIGIDLAARPIAQGQAMAEALGLKNVLLRQLDLLQVTPEFGEFDYVIAHGLYSWVPEPVRDKLLAVCRANLAPAGVAYVSYNTFPGGHLRQMTRGMMLFHAREVAEPRQRVEQARGFVQFLAESQPNAAMYQSVLTEEQRLVEGHSDGALYHDDLGAVNDPVYFFQFAEHAARHGLQYLAEADFSHMQDGVFLPAVRDALRELGDNQLLKEQYIDFLRCRRFRQTLLCHAEVPLQREPRPELMAAFSVSSPARPVSAEPDLRPAVEEEFRGLAGAAMKSTEPLAKAAILVLAEEWPRAVPFHDLLVRARDRAALGSPGSTSATDALSLGNLLLQTYAAGLVQLHVYRPPIGVAGARPAVTRLARLQAQAGEPVTTLRHTFVLLRDSLAHLVRLLDGTRDRDALLRDLWHGVEGGQLTLLHEAQAGGDPAATRAHLASQIEASLAELARIGLLLA